MTSPAVAMCSSCGREGVDVLFDTDERLVLAAHSPIRHGKWGIFCDPDEICPGAGQPRKRRTRKAAA
jgi:hypothetical protein